MTMRYKRNGLIEALNGIFDMTTVNVLRSVSLFVFNYGVICWEMRGWQDVVGACFHFYIVFLQQQEEEQEVRVSQLFNTLLFTQHHNNNKKNKK